MPTPTPAPTNVDVAVGPGNSLSYAPANITIPVGSTVTWTWMGSLAHSVTSSSGETFDSGVHTAPNTFAHTFTIVGKSTYFCLVHGTIMSGSVTVQ
jgi:plastocyanin